VRGQSLGHDILRKIFHDYLNGGRGIAAWINEVVAADKRAQAWILSGQLAKVKFQENVSRSPMVGMVGLAL